MTESARLFRRRGARLRGNVAFIAVAVLVLGLIVVMATRSMAVASEPVTFVNATGETLWIGSTANADGSRRVENLPTLRPGESATIVIPDDGQPGHWRGTFFARQRCSGDSGSTFKCLVGDCGVYADLCATGEQPASLAEFNFDQNDASAPWYDVSYVNAVSLAITIEASSGSGAGVAGSCSSDCSRGELLAACPGPNAINDPERGDRINCINPSRDAESWYTKALGAYGPQAYLWSTNDRVAGNKTVFNCAGCAGFSVTFHNPATAALLSVTNNAVVTSAESNASPFTLRGYEDKCIDVPGGISADGAQLQLWDCNGTPGQAFSHGPNGSLMVLDKCMDVAWASQDNGAKVQLANCNGGPAQVWVAEGAMLRNPNSNKCVDVRDWNAANGAPLQIWDCNPAGQANQSWRVVGG